MVPTTEQVRVAAYHRWERRGGGHGRHDADWSAAEQQLLFALNYELVALHRPSGPARAVVGRATRRVCRFCEQAEPRTRFADPAFVLPGLLGEAVRTRAECDECREAFRDGVEADLEAALSPIRPGVPLPIGAFKGLVRAALAVLPDDELDYFPDAIEWVLNPDHDLDGDALGDLGCNLHATPATAAAPFAALARRRDDEGPFPHMLFFLGFSGRTLQLALPLCVRDQDLDDEPKVVPRVANPADPFDPADPCAPALLPIAAPAVRRGRLMPNLLGL